MIRILGDRVLVALPPRDQEFTTESGLVLMKDPDLRTPTRGIVVALGEKVGTIQLDDAIHAVTEGRPLDEIASFAEMRLMVARLRNLAPAPFDVALNDCVIFPPSAGEAIDDGGITYVILHETDILGVLEPLSEKVA